MFFFLYFSSIFLHISSILSFYSTKNIKTSRNSCITIRKWKITVNLEEKRGKNYSYSWHHMCFGCSLLNPTPPMAKNFITKVVISSYPFPRMVTYRSSMSKETKNVNHKRIINTNCDGNMNSFSIFSFILEYI